MRDTAPYIPYTPEEIVQSSIECWQAGASIVHIQFVLGTPWGAPATPKSLLHLHEHIPHNATWSVIGIGKSHLPMSMMGLIMGGHIRVGMEDNIYYKRGVLAETNVKFMERIVRIAREYGREIASPQEARKILRL
jgi:3-keto-5-aminohexanoate cleavage enzyme